MFRCDTCNKVTKIGEKQNKKVIETRKKTYYYTDQSGNEIKTEGTEIVKELNLCDECFMKQIKKD